MDDKQLTVFLAYTARFDEVMQGFPKEVRLGDYAGFKADFKAKESEIEHFLARYLNLCAEEQFLASEGLIDSDVWKIWQGYLKAMMSSPSVRDVWREKMRSDFAPHKEFVNLVDSMIAED